MNRILRELGTKAFWPTLNARSRVHNKRQFRTIEREINRIFGITAGEFSPGEKIGPFRNRAHMERGKSHSNGKTRSKSSTIETGTTATNGECRCIGQSYERFSRFISIFNFQIFNAPRFRT